MKTTAFLIRVAICFLLSLIPVTELENRIYSSRITLRGQWGEAPPIAIVDLDSGWSPGSPHTRIIAELGQFKPSLILFNPGGYTSSGGWRADSDGVVRRASTKTLESFRDLHLDAQLTHRPKEPHLINFKGPAGSFRHCKMEADEAADTCGPELAGKVVIVQEGPTDLPKIRTPIGEMNSAEVLANDLYTVVYHHPIYQSSFIERGVLTLAMILISAFYIIYYPVLVSAIAVTATGTAIVVVLLQLIFHIFDVYIPSANIGLSMLITYLVFTGYRLAFQENLQWRSLKQAQYLRELDQMKTNFLSLVSHDLKTPLAKIQAVAERMRRELHLPPDERSDWKDLVDSIENSNNELKHFITSILNLSRIESQKVILNKKSNDINQLIYQALKRLRPLASQKNIFIEEALDPLFSVECDEDLMRQVLSNLIDNAIKYSPNGSKIVVRSREEEGFIRVDVEDFGPGIPKDQLPLMFRKFSRYMRPIQEQVKGTGLGLYLSKYFIELHGGTIRLKSVEGQGTTFTFTLPLHGVESETILG